MLEWITKNYGVIISGIITVLLCIYMFACEPKVKSLTDNSRWITRAELQIELDALMKRAEIKMTSLDRQEAIRSMILNNALIVAEGQPLNPVGLLTAFAALYGVSQAGSKTTTAVKNYVKKRKANNGSTEKTTV